MGQQQLLLVILVTIIVGIATVVAINTFSSAADSANVDAVRNDLASIAASSQGYYMRPDMLGGGGRSFTGITFEDISFATDSITTNGTVAYNENGEFTLTANDQFFTVLAEPATASGSIAARVCPDDMAMGDYDPDSQSASAPSSCD